jgi:hypothetical protein
MATSEATERGKGGIFYPDDIDEKAGKIVQSVLDQCSHQIPLVPPDFVDLDITGDQEI